MESYIIAALVVGFLIIPPIALRLHDLRKELRRINEEKKAGTVGQKNLAWARKQAYLSLLPFSGKNQDEDFWEEPF